MLEYAEENLEPRRAVSTGDINLWVLMGGTGVNIT